MACGEMFRFFLILTVQRIVSPNLQFCEHFSSLFRSETCSPTASASLKLSSSRLKLILDDCCGSLEQLKSIVAASFSFKTPSSLVKSSSPAISQFVRVACSTAGTTARMLVAAAPPSIPHAVAAATVDVLAQMKVVSLFLSYSHLWIHFYAISVSAATC
jgi:hypothetical protein